MTMAERRTQSAGVARITDCLPGDASEAQVAAAWLVLEHATGRTLDLAASTYDGRHTVLVFAVTD